MIIRKAQQVDTKGIARVHVDSWITTYRGIVPDELLNQLSYEKREKLWEQNLSKRESTIFVVEDEQGEIVGFADGSRREQNHVDGAADLTSIYLLQNAQGKGMGQQLVTHLLQSLKEQGYSKVFVEVLEENQSKTFYEKMGATFLEDRRITIAGKELDLLVYQWVF